MKKVEITNHCYSCNRRHLLYLLLLTAFVLIFLIIAPIASVSFQQDSTTWSDAFLYPTKPIIVDGNILKVSIARSLDEIVQGLSNHQPLAKDEGMLFLFADSNHRTFWMKDMLFNIDMIFINEGVIVDIKKDMPAPNPWQWPATYTSQNPADAVLEVNSGLSDHLGWEVGDKVTSSQ
jgi:uncharacterized membrane protein (UPF0127 family)